MPYTFIGTYAIILPDLRRLFPHTYHHGTLTIKPLFMIYHKYSNPALQAVEEMIQFRDNYPLNRASISKLFPHYYSNRNIIYAAFESETGKSIKEYRTRKLMEAAASLIAQGELTIQQVAYKCGYRGPKAGSNFTRAFKKTLKITPKQWKKRQAITLGRSFMPD